MAIPVLIGVTLLIFAITMCFSPVERASLYVTDPKLLRNIDEIIAKYHLNDPFYIQYFNWMSEVLHGNLGWSESVHMPVSDAIINFLPATLELALFSAPLIIFIGIKMGVLSAVHQNELIDHVTRVMAIVGWSLPTFWSAILLLSAFYGHLGLFPPGRLGEAASAYVHSPYFIRYTRINTIDSLLNGQFWIFVDALRHLILPVANLVLLNTALIMRIMRSSMLESLSKGYVMMARAKGLDERTVINKHAKRTALIPAITISGMLFAGMVCGMVITETVFCYTGIGYWAAHAAGQLDIPAVLGFALFVGVIFVFANLAVDILYVYINPKVSLG